MLRLYCLKKAEDLKSTKKGKENLEKCKDMIKEENIIEAINAQKFSSNKEYYIEIYKT